MQLPYTKYHRYIILTGKIHITPRSRRDSDSDGDRGSDRGSRDTQEGSGGGTDGGSKSHRTVIIAIASLL